MCFLKDKMYIEINHFLVFPEITKLWYGVNQTKFYWTNPIGIHFIHSTATKETIMTKIIVQSS